MAFSAEKSRMMWCQAVKAFQICLAVLTQCRSVTDRQTDRTAIPKLRCVWCRMRKHDKNLTTINDCKIL